MPTLHMHQLRVAAVAYQVCDKLNISVDSENIVKACLLHDMANIIKMNLSDFPEFLKPEGYGYWQEVKNNYAHKYQTSDEHKATLAIAKELGVSERVYELIEAVGFLQGPENAASTDYGRKICAYSDMRVGPHGIISMEDRLIEAAARYTKKKYKPGERQDPFALALRQIESNLFSHSSIKPGDIDDKTSEPVIEKLKQYSI